MLFVNFAELPTIDLPKLTAAKYFTAINANIFTEENIYTRKSPKSW
jgi:hypothetical protein